MTVLGNIKSNQKTNFPVLIPDDEVIDDSKKCGGDDLQVVVQQGQITCTSKKRGNFKKGEILEWSGDGMTCSRNNKNQDEIIQWELNNLFVNFQLKTTSSSNSYCPLQFTATFQHVLEGNATSTAVLYTRHFKDSRKSSANNKENYIANRKGGIIKNCTYYSGYQN